MKTQIFSGAFLTYKNKVLLMKRGIHKKIAPGFWSCVGGRMESGEFNNPITTCYREIKEESGIDKNDIVNLNLRYITMSRHDSEIHTVYYFMGNTAYECNLPECDEGTLRWVYKKDICGLSMTFSVTQMINHWVNNPDDTNIYLIGRNRNSDRYTIIDL